MQITPTVKLQSAEHGVVTVTDLKVKKPYLIVYCKCCL